MTTWARKVHHCHGISPLTMLQSVWDRRHIPAVHLIQLYNKYLLPRTKLSCSSPHRYTFIIGYLPASRSPTHRLGKATKVHLCHHKRTLTSAPNTKAHRVENVRLKVRTRRRRFPLLSLPILLRLLLNNFQDNLPREGIASKSP